MLINNAKLNIWNINGEDIYILASQCNNIDVFKLILTLYMSKGNEIDKESSIDKMNFFMRAVYAENYLIAKYLKK